MVNLFLLYAKFRYYMCSDPCIPDATYDQIERALSVCAQGVDSGPVPWQYDVVDCYVRHSNGAIRLVHYDYDTYHSLAISLISP